MKLIGNMKIENNELFIGNVSAKNLAKEYGTPLYVMDEALIRENCKKYYTNFKVQEKGNKVAYAGKAFLTLAMCRIVKEEGLCLDVVSDGELYTAYKSGFPLEKIYFHGNNKSDNEIQLGIELGVGTFVCDGLYEIERINNIAKSKGIVQNILIRISPGIEAHTHDYIKTGQIDSKFGFPLVGNTVIDVVEKIKKFGNINLKGLHCHIGSQIFDTTPYKDAGHIMISLMDQIKRETGIILTELDLGGGFGVYYTEEDKPKEFASFCDTIINAVEEKCEELRFNTPTLVIEPGRSIVGNAGTTLYTVGTIKEIEGIRKYVSVDGGMTDNIRPALYGAAYGCAIANRVNEDSELETVTVAGKCCESGDILLNNVKLPKVQSGDILAIFTTGAYGFSMSSNYNRILKPAVVMVKDGECKVISKRQTFEQLIENEI